MSSNVNNLTPITGANLAPNDLLHVVDVSDTAMNASGTDKKITRQELQTYNAGTLTSDVKVADYSATWNNGAVTFTALKFNATDTASAAGSLLMDLQVGGSSKFRIDKNGYAYFPAGSVSTPSINLSGPTITSGFFNAGDWDIRLTFNGKTTTRFTNTVVRILDGLENQQIAFDGQNAAIYFGTSEDVQFGKDFSIGADAFQHARGTNPQIVNIYNTKTDNSNYERLSIKWSSNVCYSKNENAGTGSARLYIPVTGATTVSGLPSAATAGAGARAFVTDATATTFLSTVAGGGANKVPVVSDGTNWLIG